MATCHPTDTSDKIISPRLRGLATDSRSSDVLPSWCSISQMTTTNSPLAAVPVGLGTRLQPWLEGKPVDCWEEMEVLCGLCWRKLHTESLRQPHRPLTSFNDSATTSVLLFLTTAANHGLTTPADLTSRMNQRECNAAQQRRARHCL